ncbi:YbjN domain-containing protein [Pollutimonas bauzanensis]|uniref:Putative sensory transduction regulator n=1 Tax=Pollutimonas bauzanensis TaxID=658167 RepID=A0A1M5ZM77_9BURK|nr:YbjN domain-containing protein [Pollutimonas bauzanensis]SHI25281.1 Putative sensory transduction regulator [Pollutimonas bauzanensis]
MTNTESAKNTESAQNTELVQSISIDQLTGLLQSLGYRVTSSEQNGQTQLLSATQGIGFALRFGNPAPQAGRYLDYTLSCALRVQGDLPENLVPQWNITKRFARLARQGDFLVLEMDVIVAGGVSDAYLRANTELWDHLLQQFLLFLRTVAAQPGASDAPAAPAGVQDAADAQVDAPQENHEDSAAQAA